MIERCWGNIEGVRLTVLHHFDWRKHNVNMNDLLGPNVLTATETLMRNIRVIGVVRRPQRGHALRPRSPYIDCLVLTGTGGPQIDSHKQKQKKGCKTHLVKYSKGAVGQ